MYGSPLAVEDHNTQTTLADLNDMVKLCSSLLVRCTDYGQHESIIAPLHGHYRIAALPTERLDLVERIQEEYLVRRGTAGQSPLLIGLPYGGERLKFSHFYLALYALYEALTSRLTPDVKRVRSVTSTPCSLSTSIAPLPRPRTSSLELGAQAPESIETRNVLDHTRCPVDEPTSTKLSSYTELLETLSES